MSKDVKIVLIQSYFVSTIVDTNATTPLQPHLPKIMSFDWIDIALHPLYLHHVLPENTKNCGKIPMDISKPFPLTNIMYTWTPPSGIYLYPSKTLSFPTKIFFPNPIDSRAECDLFPLQKR